MSKIFISYRREDTAGYAISLHSRLADRFGADQLFMDLDSIEPGDDFVQVINEKVGGCQVLVVLIGRSWLTCRDEQGQLRLEKEDDFVRLEVAAALERKIRVIPVLVGGARPPKADELCAELAPLCRRNAVILSDNGFWQDVARLIESLEKTIKIPAEKAPLQKAALQAAPIPKAAAKKALAQKAGSQKLKYGDERIFRAHGKPVKTVAFSPDSQILASAGGGSWFGGGDTAIRLWRVSDGRLLRELAGHAGTVNKIVFSPDGQRLASCCSKSTYLWRTSDGKQLKTLTGPDSDNGDYLAFSRDGSRLVRWHENPEDYDVWSMPNGKYVDSYSLKRLPAKAEFQWEHVSPDGRLTTSDEQIRVEQEQYWAIVIKRATGGATLFELRNDSDNQTTEWKFSADGEMLVAGYLYSNTIGTWRVSDGKLLSEIHVPDAPNSVAFSLDGKWLAAGCEDKLVRVWPILQSPSK